MATITDTTRRPRTTGIRTTVVFEMIAGPVTDATGATGGTESIVTEEDGDFSITLQSANYAVSWWVGSCLQRITIGLPAGDATYRLDDIVGDIVINVPGGVSGVSYFSSVGIVRQFVVNSFLIYVTADGNANPAWFERVGGPGPDDGVAYVADANGTIFTRVEGA